MRSGKLRHPITIQQKTESRDAAGGVSEAWGTFVATRAEKLDLSGREYFAAAQVNAEKSVKFRLRWVGGVTEKMRVLHDGTAYDINAILNPDGKKREMLLVCKA